ncbi:MAG: TolC family protein [Candidatus Krumholzibacteriota bacterium]|nr:TolC family protein [Candidatus Krumholzibacteriota bacterium]
MRMKLIPVFIVLCVLAGSGCGRQRAAIALPEPRPLGGEFDLYQTPVRPAEIAGDTPDLQRLPARSMEVAGDHPDSHRPPARSAGNTRDSLTIEPSGILTMRQALALALLRNPRLRSYSWKVRETEARRLEASLRPNPELAIEVEEVGGPGKRREFDGALFTLQLSRLIELGGKRGKRERLASLDNALAGWDYESARIDLLTEVTKSFVAVLAAQQKKDFTEELLRLSEKLMDAVSIRVEAGKDSPLEETKAAVAHSSIRIEHQRALRELELSRKRLCSTWGGDQPRFEVVAGKLDTFSPLPPLDSLTRWLGESPPVARWSLEMDKRRAALELERAKALPDFTLSGGMQRFNDTGENLLIFGISIPLQLSNRNQAGKRLAAYELAGAGESRKADETRIRIALTAAYTELAGAYQEALELRDHVLLGARSVFDRSMLSYREGKLDYLHLLDAQRTLFDARIRYIEVLAEYHKAKTDVERIIGRSIDDNKYLSSEDYE